jgi:hypothetical protein
MLCISCIFLGRLKAQLKGKQTPDKKREKADGGANGGQCIAVGVAHHLQVSSEICCSIFFGGWFWDIYTSENMLVLTIQFVASFICAAL